ncbi:hypothetical protein SAZ_32020 [Streptomyces noursei ZPM]|uniref:Uncharacterized protein n=1 Tax=Streptomyces noursei TaxID=1971 RepID=A0A059WG45_STRNR|nr:hypothetical protein [Streptomyces noursei]AKA08962.1 hypothetical protein SAZ_32020 [Streptomyces noursei ZPM]AIA06812.1 hypothetical protein DC74_6375 [Streptomyces noursei]EOT01294.1 hypothetical protein K530_24533 [Streptomyces noursei CCRC 11814]EXU87187.1 hypothetical protein P354_37550 [Streptomyces noursei PD-1]MCZ0974522.1 hypothetical protein [Streptomyces noursei]
MFSRKKIATIVALMGGLTAASVIAPQAHAADGANCDRGVAGDRTCVHKTEGTYRTKDGDRVVIRQMQRCSTAARQRVVWPESGLAGREHTDIGPRMNCSNHFLLPKGFKRPRVDF